MEQEINKQGKPYRITIETIGAEEDVFNSGAPLIIETDGFFAITCERHETEDARSFTRSSLPCWWKA